MKVEGVLDCPRFIVREIEEERTERLFSTWRISLEHISMRLFLRRAKRGVFLMEQGGGERVKRIEWVSSVVDVGGCNHFAGFIARVFLKARSPAWRTEKRSLQDP